MARTSATNWKVVKNEYEILGTGIKELAASHHTTGALVRAAIEEGQWKRLEDLNIDDISSRLAAMEARHQTELVPRFILLQTKMLEKCDEMLDSVQGLEDARGLQIVSEVIEKHRPSIMGKKDDAGKDNAITVRILSKVGGGDDVSVSAVEVTTAAGATNGTGVPHGTPLN